MKTKNISLLIIFITFIIAGCDSLEGEANAWQIETDYAYMSAKYKSRNSNERRHFEHNMQYGVGSLKERSEFIERVNSIEHGILYYELNRHESITNFIYYDFKDDGCLTGTLYGLEKKLTDNKCLKLREIGPLTPVENVVLPLEVTRTAVTYSGIVQIKNFDIDHRSGHLINEIRFNDEPIKRMLDSYR